MLNFKSILAVSGLALSLVSCGGGSSDSGPSTAFVPPIPPPPSNSAPVAAISFSQGTAQAADIVTLDASQSSDADGDALTFSYTILDGPEVDLSNAADMNEITVPALRDSVTLRVQLTVSDGQASDTAEAELAISAARLPGFTNVVFEQSFGNDFVTAARLQLPPFDFPDGRSSGFGFGLGIFTSDDNDVTTPPNVDVFVRDTDTDVVNLLPEANITGLQPFSLPAIKLGPQDSFNPFGIVSELENRVDRYEFDPFVSTVPTVDFGLDLQYSFDVEAPCAHGTRFRDSFFDQDGQLRPLVVGQRNAGLSVYQEDERFVPPTLLARLNDGGSYCVVMPVHRILDKDLIVTDGADSALRRITSGRIEGDSLVLAYEENSRTLNLFEVVQSSGALNNIQRIDIDLDTNEDLTFVKGITFNNISSDGIALIFADDTQEGEHRIVIAGINGEREILQVTQGWDFGTPNDILYFIDTGFLISAADSPDAIFFRTAQFGDIPGQTFPPFMSRVSDLPITGPFFQSLGREGVDKIFISPYNSRDIATIDFDTATVTALED